MAERHLSDRAQLYDRALRQSQSQHVTVSKRRNLSKSGASVRVSSESPAAEPIADAATPAMSSKPPRVEATMEESNLNPFPKPGTDIAPEDLANDGGVGSELGESYVDGKVSRARTSSQPTASQERAADRVEDGGMLGLFAQIYDTRGPGYARVI